MTLALPHFLCRCCKQCQRARQRHRAFSTSPYNWSQARPTSYYDLLGIKKDASPEEIKRAFFIKSKKLHPDSNPGNPDLHNQFVKLNEAYSVLSRESSRREYDIMRGVRGPAPYRGRSAQGDPYDFSNTRRRSRTEPNMEEEYEEWVRRFHYRKPFTAEEAEERRQGNLTIVHYLVWLMVGVSFLQFLGYRKFSEITRRQMDEKNEYLNRIYNETKERARVKRKQRQLELLSQKPNQLIPRYYTRCEQFSTAAAGPLGSAKGQAHPIPAAK